MPISLFRSARFACAYLQVAQLQPAGSGVEKDIPLRDHRAVRAGQLLRDRDTTLVALLAAQPCLQLHVTMLVRVALVACGHCERAMCDLVWNVRNTKIKIYASLFSVSHD